ncbi:MAG: hypothetical protein ACHQ7H_03380 [Candidatus Rokuibacteriota bacterium]
MSRVLRPVGAAALVLILLVTLSPVYRDFFLDRRDRYRGSSFTAHLGPMEYDRQVMRQFTWGGWFWDPYRAMGMPRLQDLGMRPLYPPQLVLVRFLPTEAAWHWNHVLHVLIKVVGLVLLCAALGWPFWIVVLTSAGAMLAEGSLVQFGDTTMLISAAWLPLQLWLTLQAARRSGFTVWDAAWSLVLALRVLSFHPQYGAYYEVLVVLFTLRVEFGALRARLPALALRYMAAGLLLAPALIPGYFHYLESGRRRIVDFDDWHMRRAYLWWNYGLRWSDFLTSAFLPWLAWLAIAASAFVGRLSGTIWWPVFGAYAIFALFHAVPYLAFPMWLTGRALFPFRIPQRVFEPFMWLGIVLLAELLAREIRPGRRRLLAGLLVLAFGACAWQTQHDPRAAYVVPRWSRALPVSLAETIRRSAPTHVVVLTGPDAMADAHEPILNSNHADFLRIPSAHFTGQLPTYHFNRMAYRVPGLLLLPRGPTHLDEWDAVVDVYAELGIGWVIWDGEGDPVHPRLEPVGEESGFRLFRIRDGRPMVYALDRARVVPSPARPAGGAALVYNTPALGPFCYGCPEPARWSPADQVTLRTDWRAGDVTVTSEAPAEAFVVLNETRSLGWSAQIDGRPTTIYPVNEAFQGVLVPAGRHVIRWRFASPGFTAGGILAGVGVAGLVVAPWWFRRRLRSRDA